MAGFSAIEALQAFGLGAQMQNQRRQLQRQEQELARREETRGRVSTAVGSGDYRGATQAAIAGGEYDLAGTLAGLGENERAQALQEAQIMGRAAQQIRALPPEQRASAYQQLTPLLRQAGFTDEELAGADLSDTGLDGYMQYGQNITAVLQPQRPTEEPSVVRTLRAAGIDPQSEEGRRLIEASIAAPRNPQIIMVDGVPQLVAGGGAAPAQPSAGPPPAAVEHLRQHPELRGAFDAKYGPGAADRALGGASPSGSQTFP